MVKFRNVIVPLSIFIIALIIRAAIFYGTKVPTGDAGEFATFEREIYLNKGLVPDINEVYYPGSLYIYPPAIFLFIYYLNQALSFLIPVNGNLWLNELLYLTIFTSAMQSVVLFLYLKKYQNAVESIFSAFMLIFFDVSIYALSWGGYPDIISTFFLVLLLIALERRGSGISWTFYSMILIALIAFTHDLTYFFSELCIIGILIFDVVKRNLKPAISSFCVLAAGGAAGLYWWLPKIRFVISALTVPASSGAGIFNPVVTKTVIFQAVPFMMPVVFVALLELYAAITLRKIEPLDTFSIALICSLAGLAFIPVDLTITGRIILYSYTLLMIIVLKNLNIISKSGLYKKTWLSKKKYVLPIISIFIVAAAPTQLILANHTVSYYNSGDFAYSQSLITYGEDHFNNSTVIAPSIGNYLSAETGARVIIYSGFIVGSVEIEERNAALSVILNSTSRAALSNLSKYDIKYVVIQSIYLNTTFDGHLITFPASYYMYVGTFDSYTLYEVKANA